MKDQPALVVFSGGTAFNSVAGKYPKLKAAPRNETGLIG